MTRRSPVLGRLAHTLETPADKQTGEEQDKTTMKLEGLFLVTAFVADPPSAGLISKILNRELGVSSTFEMSAIAWEIHIARSVLGLLM